MRSALLLARSLQFSLRPLVIAVILGLVLRAIYEYRVARALNGLPDGAFWVEKPTTLRRLFEKKNLDPLALRGATECAGGGKDFEGDFDDHRWIDDSGKWIKSPINSFCRHSIGWDTDGWEFAADIVVDGLVITGPASEPPGISDYRSESWHVPRSSFGEWAAVDKKYEAAYGVRHRTRTDGESACFRTTIKVTNAKEWTWEMCQLLIAASASGKALPDLFILEKLKPSGFNYQWDRNMCEVTVKGGFFRINRNESFGFDFLNENTTVEISYYP